MRWWVGMSRIKDKISKHRKRKKIFWCNINNINIIVISLLLYSHTLMLKIHHARWFVDALKANKQIEFVHMFYAILKRELFSSHSSSVLQQHLWVSSSENYHRLVTYIKHHRNLLSICCWCCVLRKFGEEWEENLKRTLELWIIIFMF